MRRWKHSMLRLLPGLIVLGLSAGCVPDPPGSGPTSTTTSTAPTTWFPAGCYGSMGTGLDFRYFGPQDTLGNAQFFYTTDGTCGGEGTIVAVVRALASDSAGALQLCQSLGLNSTAYLPEFGYAVPDDAWGCGQGKSASAVRALQHGSTDFWSEPRHE
jgi:hypothetical protein